jgi:hypothetical protein
MFKDLKMVFGGITLIFVQTAALILTLFLEQKAHLCRPVLIVFTLLSE